MKVAQLKLVFVKDPDGGYTAYIEGLPGIIVEVDRKEDAPEKLCRVLRVALQHLVHHGNYYEFAIPLLPGDTPSPADLTEGGGE